VLIALLMFYLMSLTKTNWPNSIGYYRTSLANWIKKRLKRLKAAVFCKKKFEVFHINCLSTE